MPTPKQRYLKDLSREGFVADPAQAAAVDALEDLYQRLVAKHSQPSAGLLGGCFKNAFDDAHNVELPFFRRDDFLNFSTE